MIIRNTMRKVEFFSYFHISLLWMFKVIALKWCRQTRDRMDFWNHLVVWEIPIACTTSQSVSRASSLTAFKMKTQGSFQVGPSNSAWKNSSLHVLLMVFSMLWCFCSKCTTEFFILLLVYMPAVGLSSLLRTDISHLKLHANLILLCASKKNFNYIELNVHLILSI